jgi:signal transduction histidine kinase
MKPVVSVWCMVKDKYVAIEVENNGAGTSATVIDKIFEPLFTKKPLKEFTQSV